MSFQIDSQERLHQHKVLLAAKDIPNQVSKEETLRVCKKLLAKYKSVFDALKSK